MKKFLKATLFVAVLSCFAFISQNSTEKVKFKVVIDAGHGGEDAGNVSEGIHEGQITLKIVEKIKKLHSNKNVELYFTRTNNEGISLNDRAKFINNIKPDLVISLHTNAHKSEQTNGLEIFIKDNHFKTESEKAAGVFSTNLAKVTKFREAGVKTANFTILRESKAPALLIELGFLTNPQERGFVASEEGQEIIAKALLQSIDEI